MIRSLLIITIALIHFSCSKNIEDRLIGEWKLDVSYKKELFGRDYFTTGFENGIFRFYESGLASYIGINDTLSGYWKSDYYSRQNYNSSTGESESERLKYLEVFLANFQNSKILRWDFEEYDFRNNWKNIRAIEYTLGRDRYYEFIKH